MQLLATSPAPLAATAHHRGAAPYVLGAVVIAILAIGLMLQLIVWTRRARRRP